MLASRLFKDDDTLYHQAEKNWYECSPADWQEAFSHHPRIGDIKNIEKRFAETKDWANSEQRGVEIAIVETIKKLARLNRKYEKRFGYIFIVYATGKTAAEMLDLLESRLTHAREDEIKIAMEEQNKITKLRLQKLLS